ILEKLGGGGMGVVYKARDTKLDRTVALKFLPLYLSTDEEAKQRFIHEAKAASSLDHPNIGTIHEIDETDDGQLFIAMAFYAGETLKAKIARGALPVEEALDYAQQIAAGLAKAHERGIVHRDIKPANVMVTLDGVVKIVDFGLAKVSQQTQLTKTGTTLGTVSYMSPEQIHGDVVDHRTDLWSWGVVFYEMLTGERPFKGPYEQALVYSILNESPLPPTEIRDDLPGDVGRIILKGLRKDRGDRYRSAGQLLSDLKAVALEGKQPAGLVAQKPAPKKETERRQATVLFATIAGYAEMLERMDPEEVAAVLNRSVALFGSVAQQYGGTMDQVMGPCIRVLFGVPVALEQAPQKAIHAAIAMRKRLHQAHRAEQLPVSLDLEIGINTGMVIAGALGTAQEYTVMGETVELASQLMERCAEGQIYVGPSTYRYTRREFDFTEHKPMTVKGRKAPVAVYALLSERAEVHRPRPSAERMIHSEMVGRDRELDRLKLHVLKVINGEGSIVSVIGEAGIGKSRLIAELRKIEDLKKVTLLKGRALSLGKNLSYHPLLDVLKKWAGITEEDTAAASTAKLERAIERIHPEGVAEVFPFIATLMGMKLTGKHAERVKGIEGEALEKLILKNMRELMVHGAQRRPTVLILEDLHWAD
ncbi:MAG: protein kinase, partial [Rhodothermales bacterium]